MYLLTEERKFNIAADKLEEQTVCVTEALNDKWQKYLADKKIAPHCRRLQTSFYYSMVPFK